MKTITKTLLLSLLIFQISCSTSETNTKNDDKHGIGETDTKALQYILDEIGGSGGLYKVTDSLVGDSDPRKHFIQFEIESCTWTNNPKINNQVVASYSALQLYQRMDKSTLQAIHGIDIRFKKDFDPSNIHQYYYEMNELEQASSALSTINKYIESIIAKDFKRASSYFDTTYYELTADQINQINESASGKLNSELKHEIFYFTPIELKNQANTKTVKMLSFGSDIELENNEHLNMKFLTTKDKETNLIANFLAE
jgi:hypothetical protein